MEQEFSNFLTSFDFSSSKFMDSIISNRNQHFYKLFQEINAKTDSRTEIYGTSFCHHNRLDSTNLLHKIHIFTSNRSFFCLRVRSSYSAFVFDLARHRFKKYNRVKITSETLTQRQLLPIQKCRNSYSLFTHLQVITSIVHFRASIISILINYLMALN